MKVIGITGGIGCGKSEVCRFIKEKYDAVIILTDDVGHEVMEPGQECYRKVIAYFTEEILNEDRTINRKKLGDIVFHDSAKLHKLNELSHPEVWKEVDRRIAQAERDHVRIVVLEAALPEGEFAKRCHEIWYIYSETGVRTERLIASRDITKEKASAIMKKQLSEDKFRSICDFVVDNSGDFEDTAKEIKRRLAERYQI